MAGYSRQIDEIEVIPTGPMRSMNSDYQQIDVQQVEVSTTRFPRVIGIFQILNGFLTAILGTCEVFLIPILTDVSNPDAIQLEKKNCFGAGLLAGFMMIITGSTAVRASISKRNTTISRFFSLNIFSVALYTGLTILLIVGYSYNWTTPENYIIGSPLYAVHIFVTISTLFGLLFALAAFIQYYEYVFFGEIQLCLQWVKCLCPYCLRKVRSRSHVSIEENEPI